MRTSSPGRPSPMGQSPEEATSLRAPFFSFQEVAPRPSGLCLGHAPSRLAGHRQIPEDRNPGKFICQKKHPQDPPPKKNLALHSGGSAVLPLVWQKEGGSSCPPHPNCELH